MTPYDDYMEKVALSKWKTMLAAGRIGAGDIERMAGHGAINASGNVATRSVLPRGGAQRLHTHVTSPANREVFSGKELVTNSDAVQAINRNMKRVQEGGNFSMGHDSRPVTQTASKGRQGLPHVPAQSGFGASPVSPSAPRPVTPPSVVPPPVVTPSAPALAKQIPVAGGAGAMGLAAGYALGRMGRRAATPNWAHIAMGAGAGAVGAGVIASGQRN